MEYWPIPFGVLQTCCKIQKCKKNDFVVFKKSMRKHIFETSNICFLDKRRKKMLEYWPYAWKQNIFYFFDILKKTGYFHTKFVFLQYKKKTNHIDPKYNKHNFRTSHIFLKKKFEEDFIFSGWAPPGPRDWAGPSQPA